jgi:hypothetical protein
MTPNELAAKILNYRRASGLVMPGALTTDIGSEAVGEALNRGWITPDSETGYLMITTEQTRIHEMQELAANVPEEKPAEEAESQAESIDPRDFALQHASRRLNEATAAYGSGQPAAPAQAPTPATVPQTSAPAPAADNAKLIVGEDVTVAEEGKAYQAKVKAVRDDGTYELSFGAEKPAVQRAYRPEELQRSQTA